MKSRRSAITLTLLALASLLWGSIVYLFAATIGINLIQQGLLPLPSVPLSVILLTLIWIGVPFFGFVLSFLLLVLHLTRGERPADQDHAILSFSIALPWTVVQWVGLGAG